MSVPTLIQIPFSHNCVKVRVALALKGVRYVTRDIAPTSRGEVRAASGQGLVPVLLVDGRSITDSTAIVLYLDAQHPDPPLVPGDPALRAECLLLEDWADRAFMALSRRISYVNVLARPGALGSLFFPKDAAAARWVKERIARRIVAKRFGISARRHAKDLTEAQRLAGIANARLGGRRWLIGERPTIADVALATMSAPLAADPECRSDREVGALLRWGEALVPADVAAVYRGELLESSQRRMRVSDLIWSFDELVRFTKWEDSEVRYWAIDRLIRHFPEACCDAVAPFVLDDHDSTPERVARHLGEHGATTHHAILLRGFKLLRGTVPGHCLQSLARLGYPGTVELAATVLHRGDLNDAAVAIIVEALADFGTGPARELVREFIQRKTELLAEPQALRGVLKVVDASEFPDILSRFMTALQWRGAQRAGEGFRTLMDSLAIDDCGWCFRTGPSGRIELRKTIKAVESGYDCDILAAMGETTVKQIAARFRAGDHAEIVHAIADWTTASTAKLKTDPKNDDPARLSAAVTAFCSSPILEASEKLGHQFQQWVVGFELSAAFAIARSMNPQLALKRARGDIDRLLKLAELETAFLLPDLPSAIAVLCREDELRSRKAQDWCLRMLEAQGPFFPKVIALETLGELRAVHFIPEVMEYLSDENSYVYGAAERALSLMGEDIVPPAKAKLEARSLDPDAAHSLLVLLCDLGSRASYEAVMSNLDWFMEEVGPGSTAEWVSLFGTQELIDPLRDWLEEDPALVGQGVLLLAAIHNVRIPEEEEILRAIEDERKRMESEPEVDGAGGGPDRDGGNYLN